jgi:hypothetical protein
MGIDLIRGGRIANRGFRATKTSNSYLKSLIKVSLESFRSTPSLAEELKPSSIKSFINVLINPDSPAIPSPSHASRGISATTRLQSPREKPNTTPALLLSSAPSLTIFDYLTFLRDFRSQLFASLREPGEELRLPRVVP